MAVHRHLVVSLWSTSSKSYYTKCDDIEHNACGILELRKCGKMLYFVNIWLYINNCILTKHHGIKFKQYDLAFICYRDMDKNRWAIIRVLTHRQRVLFSNNNFTLLYFTLSVRLFVGPRPVRRSSHHLQHHLYILTGVWEGILGSNNSIASAYLVCS